MGKLYDKADLAWNTDYWKRQEQLLHARIARGDDPASILNEVIVYPGSGPRFGLDSKPARYVAVRDVYKLERDRERMKLLKTGWLLDNLDRWQKIFKACPRCHTEPGRGRWKGRQLDKPCVVHEEGYRKAKSDVFWAGKRNAQERLERGQERIENPTAAQLDSLEVAGGSNELNKWESWYQRDKAEGVWPLNAVERRIYDLRDSEMNYKGWLNRLFQDAELTEAEYLSELGRLRAQERELEALAAPTDRDKPRMLPKQAGRNKSGSVGVSFQRDTRYSRV